MLKSRGIVVRTVKYGETSVIADIFTEEKGLRTFIAGGVRAAKTRMPFGLFQPMTIVELVSYFRETETDKGMNRLKEVRAAEIFTGIPFDMRRGAVTLLMAEVCRKCIHHSDEHRVLFEFLLDQLRWLDTTPHPVANIHLHFLIHLSGHLGFQPLAEPDNTGIFLDLKEGVYTATPPLHPCYLDAEQTQHWASLLYVPLELCHEINLTRTERKALLQKLLIFYRTHVPGFTEIHTPDVLEMVLG